MTPEPSRRLAPTARWLWRAQGLVATVVALIAAGVLRSSVSGGAAWTLLPLAVAAIAVGVVPELRWRRWRYEVRAEEIDLQHGTFVIRRTLIPIRRVQHVDTEIGPVQGMFGVATVKFHTAAGATSIPALDKGEAEVIRRRVAELAKALDDV
jgi:uncharacterized protein